MMDLIMDLIAFVGFMLLPISTLIVLLQCVI
jgi:hypothetical protein